MHKFLQSQGSPTIPTVHSSPRPTPYAYKSAIYIFIPWDQPKSIWTNGIINRAKRIMLQARGTVAMRIDPLLSFLQFADYALPLLHPHSPVAFVPGPALDSGPPPVVHCKGPHR